MDNDNDNEKRIAHSNYDSHRDMPSVGREMTENAANTERPTLPVSENSPHVQGVTRRCFPAPTEIRPGAETVRGPDYTEEDEEGTVIVGDDQSEIVEIVTAHVVNVDTEDDLRSQVESLQERLSRNEGVGGVISFRARDQPPKSILPESPPLYGREDEMQKLDEALGIGGRMAALVGGAGMGKSHCASHFARQWLQEDAAHRFVLWLESDTENVIRVSYLNALEYSLGQSVPDTEEEMSIRDIAHLVWQSLWGESQFEWMVVYDNVPEVRGDSEGTEAFSPLFFPTPLEDWGRGRILLTTRCTSYGGRIRSLGNHHVTKISVEPLMESTAVEVLMDNLEDTSLDSEIDAAKAVAELFGYMPLAIVTANSQMVDASLTVSEYLDDLKAGLAETDVHAALSIALANALTYARSHGLGDVLEVAAFLNPDQLTLELLGCDRKTARRLCRLSLLRHSGNDVYTIHRLHQKAAREGLPPFKAIASVRRVLTRFDPNRGRTWNVGISMMPHLDSLEKNVGSLPVGEKGHILKNKEYALLLGTKANVYVVLYNYEEARCYFRRSLDMQRLVAGDEEAKNADLIMTLENFGLLEWQEENYHEACIHYEEALEMKRHASDPEAKNANLVSSLDTLGNMEMELGNFDKARLHYEEEFEMQQHMFGPEIKDTDLTSTLDKLGNLEDSVGNYDKACKHYEESLVMKRRMYGPEATNTDLVSMLSKLGRLERKLGKYDKARLYLEEALEMERHVYGPEAMNIDLAATLDRLSRLERQLGDYYKAQLHLRESLDMMRHAYGTETENIGIALTIHKLGVLEQDIGNFDKARSLYEQALDMKRRVYGFEATNTDLAETMDSLGHLEKQLGNYDRALSHYAESLDIKRHVYGTEGKNTDLANTLCSLGEVEKGLGNRDAARAKLGEALDMAMDSLGADVSNHPLVEAIRKNLADLA